MLSIAAARSRRLAVAEHTANRSEAASVHAEIDRRRPAHPWGLDFLPDGGAIVTERPGDAAAARWQAVRAGGRRARGRGARPGRPARRCRRSDFARRARSSSASRTRQRRRRHRARARAKLVRDGGAARLETCEVIFSMARKTEVSAISARGSSSRRDGTLFITTGDRGEGDRAQDMQDHAGAIIRINTDGSIPADNPSPDGAKSLPEIWSKGHRNAQGAAYDPVTGGLSQSSTAPRAATRSIVPRPARIMAGR